jgi:hypothetical protein
VNKTLQDFLSMMFGIWREVADETVRHLGEDTAGLFVRLYNDALEILGAIDDAYPEEERLHSLTFVEFIGLLKELTTLQVLFLSGNYPIVPSRLRFNWERIFRARHADAYASENPGAADPPGPTLDEKHDWLTRREDKLTWKTLISPTLARLFPPGVPGEIETHFKPLWDRLNRCVHPSGELREKLVGESTLHALDAFDEAWARETHADATEVFELIWRAVLSRFPAAVPALLADPETFRACPRLRAVLEDMTRKSSGAREGGKGE